MYLLVEELFNVTDSAVYILFLIYLYSSKNRSKVAGLNFFLESWGYVGISTCGESSTVMDSVVIYLSTDKGVDSLLSFFYFLLFIRGFFE